MPFRKRLSKLDARFVAFISMRDTARAEIGGTNGLVGDDHSDLPSKPLPTSMDGLPYIHAEPTTTQPNTSPGLTVKISSMSEYIVSQAELPSTSGPAPTSITSSSDDPVHPNDHQSISDSVSSSDDSINQVHNHQSVSQFSGARNFTVNGGRFYAVGGNLVTVRKVVGTESHEIKDMLRETQAETIRRLEEMIDVRLQLPPHISTPLLYVMDATGRQHKLTMDVAQSFEQFTMVLRALFLRKLPQDQVLQKYMDISALVLTVDDGREPLQLTDEEGWMNNVQSGMTIVMSVIMLQHTFSRDETIETKYQCPFCDCWNRMNGRLLIDCRSCKRRFQVKSRDQYNGGEKTVTIAAHERNLIQNIYLRQISWMPSTMPRGRARRFLLVEATRRDRVIKRGR
ncbi:hypothetical protein M413DRAFT_444254 [Hebeloma cylindrosporum]|uniref:Ubiquitin-like domain-containing protein n=1 Tax=Hebeloma cylindrosporum TaxID=76867 RepID=A0A0C3CFZ3_HEBCY|nr:hypothetical protein M413DRAFT_444254 [Hebeloma cylindrosporum h7]